MKKIFLLLVTLCLISFSVNSQTNLSVDLSDDIYEILDVAQMRGACSTLMAAKPYTQKQIVKAIDEILESDVKFSEVEIEILHRYREKYVPKKYEKNNGLHSRLENGSEKFPMSFNYNFAVTSEISGGIYNNSDFNSFGYDIMPEFNFTGDLGKNVSYRLDGYFDFSYMPLYEMTKDGGYYGIGYNWFDKDVDKFLGGEDVATTVNQRYLKKFNNNSYMPFSYRKKWSGQYYLFSNLTASGTEGWASEPGFGFAINSELRSSFLDDKVIVGVGRLNREIAGADNGSSLVLNANAQPFYAVDMSFNILPVLKYTALTGILEYPNQDFIYPSSSSYCDPENDDDAYYYQNAFSLNMLEIDYKRIHFDFGSTVVWPKRFEIGYMMPLINYVEYQNHIGDYDNMALFGTLKYSKAGKSSIWLHGYLDEVSGSVAHPKKLLTWSRAMFAAQVGYKRAISALPFGSFSFRYTKIEPYCYTHHSINYTPWYNHYISESYTNCGEGLGYYLPPNSDEFYLGFTTRPTSVLTTTFTYQMIRHGADYGSQQVPGSSYYSEMTNKYRDSLRKHFLHDGAYNWIHIIGTGVKLNFNSKIPVQLSTNYGLMFSYYTVIDSEDYKDNMNLQSSDKKMKGLMTGGSFSDKNKYVNSDEYPLQIGAIMSIGLKINF